MTQNRTHSLSSSLPVGLRLLPWLTQLLMVMALPARAAVPVREVVFIDQAVADYAVLAAAVRPGVETELLGPAGDKLAC